MKNIGWVIFDTDLQKYYSGIAGFSVVLRDAKIYTTRKEVRKAK